MLQLKFTNLIRNKTSLSEVRFMVETLILRGLRSKNGGMVEISLLTHLKNNDQLPNFSPCI